MCFKYFVSPNVCVPFSGDKFWCKKGTPDIMVVQERDKALKCPEVVANILFHVSHFIKCGLCFLF